MWLSFHTKEVGMKAKILLVVALVLIVAVVWAAPKRYALKVADVVEAYDPDWIVSPYEEPKGDHSVSNAPECDIRGVIACYDSNQLRVDILLHNPVKRKVEVWYAVKFEYADNLNEYFTYYPGDNTFIYEKEKNGEIVSKKTLDVSNDSDFAGVTSSGGVNDTDIYIIIDKDEHIGGSRGKQYYLTTTFYSGYIDKKDTMQVADKTIPVDLYFTK